MSAPANHLIYTFRGILQRIRFRSVIARARETKAKWQMMEDFSELVERGRREGTLRMFVPIYDLSPEEPDMTTCKGCLQ